MLTADEIIKQRDAGNILIEPFNEDQLNPNSYDVRLGSDIKECFNNNLYGGGTFYTFEDNSISFNSIAWSEGRCVLKARDFYIAHTIESTTSMKYVPMITGKSSLARLGLSVHETAGFGDLGWGYEEGNRGGYKHTKPTWTLEIFPKLNIEVIRGMRIGQVYFMKPEGEINRLYTGKYQHQKQAQPSLIHKDFN